MKKSEVYLHSFESILPLYHLPQSALNSWLLKAHARAANLEGKREEDIFQLERLLDRFCIKESQISQRYFECPDVDEEWPLHEVYHLMPDTPAGANILQRHEVFAHKCQRVFSELYAAQKNIPHHLIHVSCTGYISPSPAQRYFSKQVNIPAITHAYHMGCYASLPAVRMAAAFTSSQSENVDIVHTELCSIHMNPTLHTAEQMVVQSLFADGHIKYQASVACPEKAFKVLWIKEKLLPDSGEDMTWTPGIYGMQMTLSREVPAKLRDMVSSFLQEMGREAGISPERLLKASYAIHPGGPKIIESVQKKLELSDDQVRFSKKVLYERGNMSSATLPHVWQELLHSEVPSGELVISLAFGPGLTIFGGIFEVVQS
jgi:predicted naringenin-chalcone synthase